MYLHNFIIVQVYYLNIIHKDKDKSGDSVKFVPYF